MKTVTEIIQRAMDCQFPVPCERMGNYQSGWLLWIISDSEAYWIHTKTDKVVASSRNY